MIVNEYSIIQEATDFLMKEYGLYSSKMTCEYRGESEAQVEMITSLRGFVKLASDLLKLKLNQDSSNEIKNNDAAPVSFDDTMGFCK